MNSVAILDRADAVGAALAPKRRALLRLLREPASATELAPQLGESRQHVNYHLRELERQGLVTLVEERPRRGLTERVLQAPSTYVVDPGVVAASAEGKACALAAPPGSTLAADVLALAAANALHDIGRLKASATRPPETATLVASPRISSPRRLSSFLEELSALVARYDEPGNARGRQHRIVTLVYPIPAAHS